MKKNLLLTLSVSLLSVGSLASADFKAAGTDYSKALASQEKWSEDLANEFISMPNSFACIIANSGGEVNANASWTALIDEPACGLGEADPKGATVYASSAMKSSRASNSSPQEVTAWFNASGGMRYIADVTLKKSAETLAPFGEWYFSYYQAGMQNPTTGAWTSYTKADAGDYGYVNIGPSGNDISIQVATEGAMDGAMDGDPSKVNLMLHDDIYAKVLFVNGSSDNTKFLGKTSSYERKKSDGSLVAAKTEAFVAGATSKEYYFRQPLDSSGNATGTAACFDRQVQFETTHQAGLYNATTGARVTLSGGFGFTKADGTRGYLGNWGVWIDGGETNFTPSSRTVAIADDDSVSYSLKWAPGTMQQMSLTEDTLSDGDTFKHLWYEANSEEVTAVWSAAKSKFILNGSSTTNVEVASLPREERMWSDTKRAEVLWKSGDKIKLQTQKDITFSSTLADATSTKFYSKRDDNDHTKLSSLPYSLTAYGSAANMRALAYDGGGTASGVKTYHLTGATPGGSYEPNTLYLDDGNGSLSANDKPIRFDFALNEKQNKTTNYPDGAVDAFDNENIHDKWPRGELHLILASEADTTGDTCVKGGDLSGCTNYKWTFGALPWEHSIAAYDADGKLVTLDEPIMIEYTYVATDDRNNGQSIDIVTKDEYNPLKGCTVNSGISTCNAVTPSSYAGSKFLLEYDGTDLHGTPGLEVCTEPTCAKMKYWIRLVNLKDGTELTDTKGNKYVFLANGISSTFKKEANTTNCDNANISFANLTALGIPASDLPGAVDRASTDYPLPSSAWTDAPTTSKCTVTMGDTSNCN